MTTIQATNIDSVSQFVLSYCDKRFGQDGLDIGQDVITTIVQRRMDDMLKQTDLKRWLKRLCYQQRTDHVRKIQSEKAGGKETIVSSDIQDDAGNTIQIVDDSTVDNSETRELYKAIARLGRDDRDAVQATLNGTTGRLAQLRGVSTSVINMRAKRATAKLRSMMTE